MSITSTWKTGVNTLTWVAASSLSATQLSFTLVEDNGLLPDGIFVPEQIALVTSVSAAALSTSVSVPVLASKKNWYVIVAQLGGALPVKLVQTSTFSLAGKLNL